MREHDEGASGQSDPGRENLEEARVLWTDTTLVGR